MSHKLKSRLKSVLCCINCCSWGTRSSQCGLAADGTVHLVMLMLN